MQYLAFFENMTNIIILLAFDANDFKRNKNLKGSLIFPYAVCNTFFTIFPYILQNCVIRKTEISNNLN